MTFKNDIEKYFYLKFTRRKALSWGIFGVFTSFFFTLIGGCKIKSKLNPTDSSIKSDVYLACNGTPQQNTAKVIELMGGIEKFVQLNDIVLIKPNLQWWNQGRTNLAAIKGFIDLVLNIPGFSGEIIIGENIHYMDNNLPEDLKDNIRGWTHISEINGEIDGVKHSMNSLIEMYHKNGHPNVSKVHWRDGGEIFEELRNGQNGGVITSPSVGNGYIWSDIDYTFESQLGLKKWKVKMSYPVFTSPYSGIGIDFKEGLFHRKNDKSINYLRDRSLKFINFSTINDHGSDTGITGAIKNYMGITDMSCGYWGKKPEGYSNIHECGTGRFPIRYAKAGPVAYFMKTIRKADLNIMTAEWVGWGSRIDIKMAVRKRTILGSLDPVALDFHGAKHLIYPYSKNKKYHDPDFASSPIRKYLDLASEVLKSKKMNDHTYTLHSFDFTHQS